MQELTAFLLICLFGFLIFRAVTGRIIVYEFEKGVKFRKGIFTGILDPGAHWYYRYMTSIQKIDIRPQIVSIPGQEVLSADSVSIKVSILTQFRVADAYAALTKSSSYREALYTVLQVSLREIIGASPIDTFLEGRNEYSKRLFESTNAKAAELGLELISADVKDIMFPGEMKKMFAQIVKAKKEGLAALEKARGETAALRNLANAARMLDNNPNLLQLRIVQAVSESSGNTVVLNAPPMPNVLPIKGKSGTGNRDSRGQGSTEEA